MTGPADLNNKSDEIRINTECQRLDYSAPVEILTLCKINLTKFGVNGA